MRLIYTKTHMKNQPPYFIITPPVLLSPLSRQGDRGKF